MPAIRWGLCCAFSDGSPKFRTATHRYASSLDDEGRRGYLSAVVRANAVSLAHAVERCHELGIGAFRITSQIFPLGTHPSSGYSLDELDDAEGARAAYGAARELARQRGIRLSFHPDQFVVLNSETERVVAASVTELEFQARVAALVGADVVTLHGGGGAGGKAAALDRLQRGIDRLSDAARGLLALENDDRTFTVADLLPLCERLEVPLVYDVHHHRCNPDSLSVDDASEAARATWHAREPYFHISSPRDGWSASNPRPHADFIDPHDVPASWLSWRMTVDVEAKAKERAVVAIAQAME